MQSNIGKCASNHPFSYSGLITYHNCTSNNSVWSFKSNEFVLYVYLCFTITLSCDVTKVPKMTVCKDTNVITLLHVITSVFIRSRQPANSGSYFQYQRRLLLLTFAIRTLKVYFFIWRLLTLHWSYKNKGTRKWKFLTLILGLIFCCGWF